MTVVKVKNQKAQKSVPEMENGKFKIVKTF